MMAKQVLAQAKDKMEKAVSAYNRELSTVRAGRANASLLDKIVVDYYGAPTPECSLCYHLGGHHLLLGSPR